MDSFQMIIRLIVYHVRLVIFVMMAYQHFAQLELTVQILVQKKPPSVHLEAFAMGAIIKNYVQLEVSVVMVLQFIVQLVHIALKVARPSQKTVHQEVFALAVITLKNAILGVFRLEMLSIVPRVILAIFAIELDSLNRLFFSSTLDRQYCWF